MKKNFQEHIKVLDKSLLIILGILVILTISIIINKCTDYTINYELVIIALSLIVSSIALIITNSYNSYERKKDEIKYSIEYAKEFTLLLDDISFITTVFRNSPIKEIIKKINIYEIHSFDFNEMQNILDENDIKTIENFLCGEKMNHDMILMGYIASERDIFKNNIVFPENDEFRKELLQQHLSSRIQNLLNNLEYFSMSFVHNVADDDVVYNSIHQVYLNTVVSLYYFIARNNKQHKDKYYTNIIALYERWINRDKQNQEIYNKTIRSTYDRLDHLTKPKEKIKRK